MVAPIRNLVAEQKSRVSGYLVRVAGEAARRARASQLALQASSKFVCPQRQELHAVGYHEVLTVHSS